MACDILAPNLAQLGTGYCAREALLGAFFLAAGVSFVHLIDVASDGV